MNDMQEEVHLTELVPVEQSRIEDTKNDKDQNTPDGLKVIRSFTHLVNEFDSVNNKNDDDETVRVKKWQEVDYLNSEKENSKEIKHDITNTEIITMECRRITKDNNNKNGYEREIYYFCKERKRQLNENADIETVGDCVVATGGDVASATLINHEKGQGGKDKNENDVNSRLNNVDVTIKVRTNNSAILKTESDKDNNANAKAECSNKKYNCIMCHAKFKGSGGLRNHYKVVHGTGPLYKCNDCGKEFPLKERLKLHVRTHTGFKPYQCTDCGKSFARGGQLSQHRRTHSQVKPYRCALCMGSFTCAANLALHMKRHNGQKDHTCNICGKGFIRRDALKKHLECLHKDLKTFLCVICNKTFKGHLPQHMRTHAHDKPHACPTCGQKFAQKSQLTVHQRTHTGQRPFRCLVCWQAFAHSTALKLHTRRHTGERPFKCTECNVGFTQLPHWKKHMKCIHKRSKPYSCHNCSNFFRKKNDLESHEKVCHNTVANQQPNHNETISTSDSSFTNNKFKCMTLERMRLLLAVLLKRISKPERLDELGFGKRLIDEIIQDSLVSAGKQPIIKSTHTKLGEHEILQKNLKSFLEWTVPKEHWIAFRKMNKSPEEILETLTTT